VKRTLTILIGASVVVVTMTIVSLLVVRLAYFRVERLTGLHAREFTAAIQEVVIDQIPDGSAEMDYYKVFRYLPDEAKLFVVVRFEDGARIGMYAYLERQSGKWQLTKDELVWASYGSADDWTWPPYW
jgi:hypothetical protein